MARPRLTIDPDQVQKLAEIACTTDEIASVLGCSKDTLERRFAAEISKGRNECKTRLRRKQIEMAMRGNVTMLIFLGKQMLAQSEKVESRTELTGEGGGPIKTAQSFDYDAFITTFMEFTGVTRSDDPPESVDSPDSNT